MRFIIKENKLEQVIYNHIDSYYDFDNINWHHPYEFDEETDEYQENEFMMEFYYGDWEDSEYSHFIFDYFFPDYYGDEPSSVPHKKKAPILEIRDDDFVNELSTYFGDRWRPVFIKWFKDKFNLPVKTLTSI